MAKAQKKSTVDTSAGDLTEAQTLILQKLDDLTEELGDRVKQLNDRVDNLVDNKDTSKDILEDKTVEPGCQLGAADYAMMANVQKKLDSDLQDDHIAALQLIMEGMIRRNLSTTQIRKNISVFFSRVECFYRHYCLALEELSLDDLEMFKF